MSAQTYEERERHAREVEAATQAKADAVLARSIRIRRANDIEALAQRLACSSTMSVIIMGAEVHGITLGSALFNFAAVIIDEGARRRREAEADPPAEVKP